jgi:hypothetical protein
MSGPRGEDRDRIEYTRRARRILYGEHLPDVLERLKLQIPDVRRQAWGRPDMASNPFKEVWTALSTLYDRAPSVTVTADGLVMQADELARRVAGQGYWSLMARAQRDTLALREMWIRVSVAERPGVPGAYDPVFEPVYPDLVIAEASPDRPTEPHTVYHARLRERADGSEEWLWDHVSIENPAAPVYRVLARQGDDLLDVSDEYPDVGEWPDAWRDATGRPVLPYVLFHAARTPYLHDPYQTIELVEGTLNVAVLRTFVAHVARAATWKQRYGIDVEPVGAETVVGDDGLTRSRVVLDPATMAMFRRAEPESNPQVGTLDVPVLPAELWGYIEGYERKLLASAGINPADLMAMHGDPRSGYALAVSRDSQREAQRRYEPQFRAGDQEVLRLAAVMLNRTEGASYPEFGYRVTYHGIPLSAQEKAAQRQHLLELLDAGLIDMVSAYQDLHPGTTDAQALEALQAIAQIRAQIQGPAPAATPPNEVSDGNEV